MRAAEPLHRADAGLRLIRGGALRGLAYGVSMLLTAGASVLLLRHLGVADFGRYATVAALVAIVGGVTDAGLTAVGGRDLATRAPGRPRRRLLANLIGLRLVLSTLGVIAAVGFAAAAGYDRALVVGVCLAGAGLVLTAWQSTVILPLTIELRIGRLTLAEAANQAVMLIGIAVLVAAGAGLTPFFALFIGVGAIGLALSPLLLGESFVWRPAVDRAQWRELIRETLPVAASVVVGVLSFRLLIVLMSLLAPAVETGLFATSFRVVEILYGVSALAATTALPLLAVAAVNVDRIAYILQRVIEVALIGASYLVLLVVLVAEPVLDLIGGSEYRPAASVLRIQVLALLPVFVAHSTQLVLISRRRQSVLVQASGVALGLALALGLVLIPRYDATGAAIAAVVSETGWALALLILLARKDRALLPSFRFLWKPALALALAGGAALVLAHVVPLVATLAVATGLYAATIVVTRAVPREFVDAFVSRLR